MSEEVYLLQFNAETLFASRNITVLWHSLYNRCRSDAQRQPEPYHTVRRRILAEGKYVHEPVLGYKYQIISRQLIHKPVQHRLGLFEETVVKQS